MKTIDVVNGPDWIDYRCVDCATAHNLIPDGHQVMTVQYPGRYTVWIECKEVKYEDS